MNDAARGKWLSIAGMTLALLRNYDPFQAPTHFKIVDLLKKFDKTFGATGKDYGKVTGDRTIADVEKRRSDRWNFLFIAGMWFQDLFNYDFRRTEMCIIPYATQQGEISFCAYNTGIGWRNIIEKMHMTATLTKWYDEHGRHEIFAGNKAVPLATAEHTLKLNAEAVAAGRQTDLDELGIAKNAREEKLAARKKEHDPKHHAEMERLYRQHVLKDPVASQPVIQIQGLKRKATTEDEQPVGIRAKDKGRRTRDRRLENPAAGFSFRVRRPFTCLRPSSLSACPSYFPSSFNSIFFAFSFFGSIASDLR